MAARMHDANFFIAASPVVLCVIEVDGYESRLIALTARRLTCKACRHSTLSKHELRR